MIICICCGGSGNDSGTTDETLTDTTDDADGYTTAEGDCDGQVDEGCGTVWTWGSDRLSQLGDWTNTDSSVPVPVLNLTDVKAIAEKRVILSVEAVASALYRAHTSLTSP